MTRAGGRFDVIVVLGGPEIVMRHRMAHALRLFAAGQAKTLLLSGRGSRASTEAETMRDQALAAGVPADRLVLEPRARTTLENAIHCARIMRDNDWRRALLVTDRAHLPRALLTFRAIGVRVRGSAAKDAWRDAPPWMRPRHAVYEAIGLGWYLLLILSGRHRRAARTLARAQAPAAKSSKPSTAARS